MDKWANLYSLQETRYNMISLLREAFILTDMTKQLVEWDSNCCKMVLHISWDDDTSLYTMPKLTKQKKYYWQVEATLYKETMSGRILVHRSHLCRRLFIINISSMNPLGFRRCVGKTRIEARLKRCTWVNRGSIWCTIFTRWRINRVSPYMRIINLTV